MNCIQAPPLKKSLYVRRMQALVYVAFKVLTALVMKVAEFCDIMLCSLHMNRRFEVTHDLNLGPSSADFDPEHGRDTFL
jgi:hypothetical protein